MPQARVVCPLSACRARKEFITNQLPNYLGVDAVLSADLGGAPHANRKLTKVRLSNALVRYDKKREDQRVGSACITAHSEAIPSGPSGNRAKTIPFWPSVLLMRLLLLRTRVKGCQKRPEPFWHTAVSFRPWLAG